MPNGYWNRILRVNLSTGEISVVEHDAKFYRRYLGGRGIIAHYLLTEVPPRCNPLGPENALVFAASVLTGTGTPGAGRNSVGAKSPLTGGYGEGEAGGDWGARLKWAGYDGIVVTGCSPKPVYLWVSNDTVELRDASDIWGQDTLGTQTAIRAAVGDRRASVAMIGPGGERLVRFACIAFDLHDYAGRSGLGAVMGAKKLKAIAVSGKTRPSVADVQALNDNARWLHNNYEASLGTMKEMGTARTVVALNTSGALPTRNFRDGVFEAHETISGRYMTDTILVDRDACYACPVHCKRVVEVSDEGLQVRREYGGPEYETIGAFGSACGVGDIKIVAKANEMCNAASLDTISAGMMIAGAMECAEAGLLPAHLTNDLDLRFGSGKALLAVLEQMIERRGLGNILADGPLAAIQALGPQTARYFLHVKGQPLPLHEPRWKAGLGIGYALSPTGADHCHNLHDPAFADEASPGFAAVRSLGILDALPSLELSPAKARMWTYFVTMRSLWNHLCMCIFLPYSLQQMTRLVQAVTGWDVTDWELMKVSERAMAMTRLFNIRAGQTPADDTLPDRLFEPLQNGPLQGVALDRQRFLATRDLVYDMLGYDRNTGTPLAWKLYELGLDWLVEEKEAVQTPTMC